MYKLSYRCCSTKQYLKRFKKGTETNCWKQVTDSISYLSLLPFFIMFSLPSHSISQENLTKLDSTVNWLEFAGQTSKVKVWPDSDLMFTLSLWMQYLQSTLGGWYSFKCGANVHLELKMNLFYLFIKQEVAFLCGTCMFFLCLTAWIFLHYSNIIK